MIVSRGTLYNQGDKIGYFDYSAVLYPIGIEDVKNFAFFNREDIAEIVYLGYVNADEQVYCENYDSIIAKSGYEKSSVSNNIK